MDSQPIPALTDADVDRIVRREFLPADYPVVMSVLNDYGTEKWHREETRVRVAALKLAQGNLDQLRHYIKVAQNDYRDVLAFAEYPSYLTKISGRHPETAEQHQKIIEDDWAQYERWLRSDAPLPKQRRT